MKKSLLLFFAGIILFSGCQDTVTETVTYKINEPVFMSEKAFRESVKVTTQAVVISNYGKMCFYEGYIYISESGKGIHIINNTDPSNPHNVGFIELLGNADLAVRNGKLYADAFIDLVWFDISNPDKPELDGRLENVFFQYLQPMPSTGNDYGIDYDLCYGTDAKSKGIIVGWNVKERTESITYERVGWWRDQISITGVDAAYAVIPTSGSSGGGSTGGSSVGVNGSMSRFALYRDYLYSVINNYMSVVDLAGEKPEKVAENIPVGNVETIFSYRDNMFMGTPTGMMIYSVANPLKPEYVSSVSHALGCDPVVVENDIAYVTIHAGNLCGQNNNDLIIYDVSDVKTPKHLVTYAMTKPKGLGIDNGTLFICDGGLKIFDARNPLTLMGNCLAHYSGMEGYDVIPFGSVLMMIASDGLYQYDYSDLTKIHQISKVPVGKK